MRKMASDSVTEAQNAADFDKILTNAGSGLVLVHFQANWAPQCKQMNEVLTELAKDPHLVHCKFVKIEAESVPELSEKYEVAAVPTFIFLKGKGVLDRLDGANAPELTKKVKHHATPTAVVPPMPRPPKEDLDTRLKKLITQAPIMLFIKGTPDQPRCGFSKQIVQILAEHHVKYSSFNILTDEEVRQGLKKFSNWPTFPQLYVNGELLGGLDIVREMAEQGELAQHLPKEQNLDDRLKTLVKQAHVMLFMKGAPDNPRCGFSKTIISILNETGISYETFDILQDEEVRQGLKKFSNWPTYPQLYVNGELIGGLDIVKELKESGELGQTLNAGQ